jgi:hypothetical protein
MECVALVRHDALENLGTLDNHGLIAFSAAGHFNTLAKPQVRSKT